MEKYTGVPAALTQSGVRSRYGETLASWMIDPILDWEYRLKFMERRIATNEMIAAV